MHAFRSGIVDAATALRNWANSKSGSRCGRPVGFPRFKKRDRSTPTVSFVEINHQRSWLHPDRHHIRLMLPKSPPDRNVRRRREQLAWLHTTTSTRRLYRLVEAGEATIQKVTIAKRGDRWQASLLVRFHTAPIPKPQKCRGALIGVDAGVKHLAALSEPVPGLTDPHGHAPNPRVLAGQLRRLRRLDRALARTQAGSRNRRKLTARRARLHGRVSKTRALHLHHVANALAGGFDVVAVEDLNVVGMATRRRHLGRALADASPGELARMLAYKCTDHGHRLVLVGRFYPSSKTCSACGAVKAKLSLAERTFACHECGFTLDRDVNAARNIAREATRLLGHSHDQKGQKHDVAGLRPETRNADRRPRKTSPVSAGWQGSLERQNQAVVAGAAGEDVRLGRGVGNDARSGQASAGAQAPPSYRAAGLNS